MARGDSTRSFPLPRVCAVRATAAAVGVAAFISLLTLSYTRTYGSNQALFTDIDHLAHDLLVSVLDFLHVTQGEPLSTLTHALMIPVCVWILPSSFLLRYTRAMRAVDDIACLKPAGENFGKPGLNIVRLAGLRRSRADGRGIAARSAEARSA